RLLQPDVGGRPRPGARAASVKNSRGVGGRLWPPGWTAVPAVGGPCLADQATHRDDGVREVEEGVDHLLAPLVAALQPGEGIVPGVGAFDGPALPGLDRCLLALTGDLPCHAASGQFVAGFLR